MKPYILPFALYLVALPLAGWVPGWFAWLYPLVVLVLGSITWSLSRKLIRPHWDVWPGIGAGILGIAIWIALCRLDLEATVKDFLPAFLQPQARLGFDPNIIDSMTGRWLFISFRIAGLALLVPVAEELFWRGFLLRWLISADWEKVPPGQFSVSSFAGVTLLFTLAHPEWLAAAAYGAILNVLMYWRRDLWNCIVAHSVSNLILAIYVLIWHAWELW
jgi:CAAX prenyl protease-like protein